MTARTMRMSKNDLGRYRLTMGRKKESLCKKFRGVTHQISYTTIDRHGGTLICCEAIGVYSLER